jgi:glycine/D-amino acid oxidase-like deaminating enzyme
MKRNLIIYIFLLTLAPGWVSAQASVTSQVFAEVVESLAAQEMQQLHFGRFSPEASGGQVVVTPDGNRIAQGSVVLASGGFAPGLFTINGAPLANFLIQLPPGPAILTHQGSGNIMVVDQWTSDPPATTETSTQANGAQQVSIGATLSVGNIQDNPAGVYTGTFQLTFAYN